MRINTKATNIQMTDELSDYLSKRLEALDKFIDPNDESPICYVEVGKTTEHHKSGDIFRAEINLHLGKELMRAEHEGSDLYSAIDEVKDEILSKLRKSKVKRINLVKRGGRALKDMVRGFYGKFRRK